MVQSTFTHHKHNGNSGNTTAGQRKTTKSKTQQKIMNMTTKPQTHQNLKQENKTKNTTENPKTQQ